MRIWLVNHYALPPDAAGSTRHFSLARELIVAGHEALIIACGFNHWSRQHARLGRRERQRLEVVDGVPFLWLRAPGYRGSGIGRLRNMAAFAWRVWMGGWAREYGRPDVILGSSPHPFAALAASELARRLDVPFVLELRDLWPQTLIDLGKLSPLHPLVRLLRRIEVWLLRRADRIVTLLPGAGEHLSARGSSAQSVVWIPNGVDLKMVPEAAAAVAPPAENGDFTVMYAGSHGQANGLDSLLAAAGALERSPPARTVLFRFLGEGPEKKRLEKQAAALGLRRVRFEDPVPKKRLFQVLLEADAFIATLRASRLYRWGMSLNKLYDYLASARPVVFGADIDLNPVAEARAGFTVPPDDPQAMAQAIRRLVELPPRERLEMGDRGRAYVRQHHDLSRLAAALLETLQEAAHCHGRRRS